MPHNHTYADLLRLNAWIRKNSDTWYLHCTTRTVQESKLYPVPAYMTLSYFQAYYRFPELLRKIEASARQIPMDVNPAEASAYIINPLTGRKVSFAGLFSTHPPTAERIERLRSGAWR